MRFKAFLKRLYEEYENDAVADSAAALAYYFVFSLFPFLFFLATLTAYIPYVRQLGGHDRWRGPTRSCPRRRSALIETHLRGLVETPRPHLLTLGLLATVYSASRGVDALRKTLNLAYDVKESRTWWHTELVAFGMTIGGAVLTLIAITAMTAGGAAGFWLAGQLGIAHEYVMVWSWLRWPVTALVIDVLRRARVLRAPGREAEVQVHHARIGGRHAGLAAGDVGLLGLRPQLRQLQRHLRIDRRRDRAADLVLHQRLHLPDGRRDERDHRARVPRREGSGARAPGEAPPPPSERPSAVPAGAADSAAAAARSKGGIPADAQGAHRMRARVGQSAALDAPPAGRGRRGRRRRR